MQQQSICNTLRTPQKIWKITFYSTLLFHGFFAEIKIQYSHTYALKFLIDILKEIQNINHYNNS